MVSIESVQNTQRTIRGYRLLRKIGSGATASVYKAQKDEQDFALKVFKYEKNNISLQLFNRETSFATQAPQSFTASPVESFIESDDNQPLPCIAYELAPNGDMFSYIRDSGSLPVPVMKFYAKQLINGLSELHKAGICHRDLKLDNLVLDEDFNLKIIDFGLACPIQGEDGSGFSQEIVGSLGYMAPEVMLSMRYQPVSADVFSLGVILFSMCMGVMPFSQANFSPKHLRLIGTDIFWAAHEANFGAPLSAKFKDLMN